MRREPVHIGEKKLGREETKGTRNKNKKSTNEVWKKIDRVTFWGRSKPLEKIHLVHGVAQQEGAGQKGKTREKKSGGEGGNFKCAAQKKPRAAGRLVQQNKRQCMSKEQPKQKQRGNKC